MTAYNVNLPGQLGQEVERLALSQGLTIDQFILWALMEKVSGLKTSFPEIGYRRAGDGQLVPVVKGKGIRVQTLAIARFGWGMNPSQIADEYNLTEAQVSDALSFYEVNKEWIDIGISSESSLELQNG